MDEINPTLVADPTLGPHDFPSTQRIFFDPSDVTLDLDQAWPIELGTMQVMRARTGHYTLNFHLNTINSGKYLYVILHGARKSSPSDAKALFVRYDWHQLYDGPILSISDPRTESAWDSAVPRSAGYVGNSKHDLIPELHLLVDKVCDQLKIERHHVIFYGTSAGGTAAIHVGARRTAGCGVIAVCPGLRVDQFKERIMRAAAEACGDTVDDWINIRREAPYRLEPLTAIQQVVERNEPIRFIIAQCLEDIMGFKRHFIGLHNRFGTPIEGGYDESGHILSLTYHSEIGHGREPDDLSRPLLKKAIDFMDGTAGKEMKAGKRRLKKQANSEASSEL